MAAVSWLASAQESSFGRPLTALPYCSFRPPNERARLGVGVGDRVLDLDACARRDLLGGAVDATVIAACVSPVLNELIACGTVQHAVLRRRLLELLVDHQWESDVTQALWPLEEVTLELPVRVPNYTDFYASIEHAERVGRLFRPDQPLLPNYRHLPIGYHGRASSIIVSGTPVVRPTGQIKTAPSEDPSFGPTQQLDYEIEIGAYMVGGNALGEPVTMARAAEQIFGLTLVNDWSARDIQAWEYQPLGPFLGKSFATSVSPWVVPLAAFEPFRTPPRSRDADEPALLPYLRAKPEDEWTFAVTVEASLRTARMRAEGVPSTLLGRSSLAGLYWTLPQMIAHHTSNGCNLVAGDLLATGTISGAGAGEQGCLLEITRRGAQPLVLAFGETRTFLEQGDEILLTGYCEREGVPRVSLGECVGTVLPPRPGV